MDWWLFLWVYLGQLLIVYGLISDWICGVAHTSWYWWGSHISVIANFSRIQFLLLIVLYCLVFWFDIAKFSTWALREYSAQITSRRKYEIPYYITYISLSLLFLQFHYTVMLQLHCFIKQLLLSIDINFESLFFYYWYRRSPSWASSNSHFLQTLIGHNLLVCMNLLFYHEFWDGCLDVDVSFIWIFNEVIFRRLRVEARFIFGIYFCHWIVNIRRWTPPIL